MIDSSQAYFSRQGRVGTMDVMVRTPELQTMREKSIAVFGVGCLGSISVLEFARAGVGNLRLMDHDFVDPATMGRWPLGLIEAGRYKVHAISEFLNSNYPSTQVTPVLHRIGGVRDSSNSDSDNSIIQNFVSDVSLIFDATAEIGVQHYLSTLARDLKIPYIAVTGTYGAWGGKVLSIIPGQTEGCWMCYRYACNDGTIKEPPYDPQGKVQPQGCGEVTFTGAGFDMGEISIAGVRTAVSTLCNQHQGGYPSTPWDVLTMAFRDDSGQLIVPKFTSYRLECHPECSLCHN